MSVYCTDNDVDALLEGASYAQRLNETDFSAQIALAQIWMDAYLAGSQVTVPLASVPGLVRLATAHYACYLIVNRLNAAGEFGEYPQEFRAQAEKLLGDFLKGTADTASSIRDKSVSALGAPRVVNH